MKGFLPCAGFILPLGLFPTDEGTHPLTEGCPQWDEIDSGTPERMRQLYKEMNGKGGMTWERSLNSGACLWVVTKALGNQHCFGT